MSILKKPTLFISAIVFTSVVNAHFYPENHSANAAPIETNNQNNGNISFGFGFSGGNQQNLNTNNTSAQPHTERFNRQQFNVAPSFSFGFSSQQQQNWQNQPSLRTSTKQPVTTFAKPIAAYSSPTPHISSVKVADDDQDSIANSSDLCPDTAKGITVDRLGCAIDQSIVLKGVNFKSASADITDDSILILEQVSKTLSKYPDLNIEVAGYTDNAGNAAYNKALSQRRAAAVIAFLDTNGIDITNMTAVGYGEEQPIASNANANGRSQNRRVELAIIK